MIYFKYVKIIIRSQLQYRASLWLSTAAQFVTSFFIYIGIVLMFERFGNLNGWSLEEVSLCYAVTITAFALSECFARGFDMFSGQIKSGDFDRVMLRPRSTVLQVFGSSFEITKVGRLLTSAVVMAVALRMLGPLTLFKYVLIGFMVLSGAFVFTGLFVLGATVCFFTVEGLEVINVFTDGGREMASYPISIYNKWMARFFTFVVPFGCFNYLPLTYIVGRADGHELIYALTPVFGMLFIVPCFYIWSLGVKRYLSTGS